jgi:nucleoside diphosphate kinase
LFGSDKTRNAVHGSDSVESAARETTLAFSTFLQTTFAWIKPDAVAAGHADAIITRIKKDG